MFGNYLYHHSNMYPWFYSSSINWDAVSAGVAGISIIVLAVTARVIYLQVLEARKSTRYLEYSVKPNPWFVFISGTTIGTSAHVNNRTTKFMIMNGSKFKVLFYFKIDWKLNGEVIHSQDSRWEDDPLHIYPEHSGSPGKSEYMDVIKIENVLGDRNTEDINELVADIKYRVAPSYSPDEKHDGLPETWRFDLNRNIWIGPNGVEDNSFK